MTHRNDLDGINQRLQAIIGQPIDRAKLRMDYDEERDVNTITLFLNDQVLEVEVVWDAGDEPRITLHDDIFWKYHRKKVRA